MTLAVADRIAETSRKRDLAMIHVLARKLNLPRDRYESYLERWTGSRSSALLSHNERQRVLDKLNDLIECSDCL